MTQTNVVLALGLGIFIFTFILCGYMTNTESQCGMIAYRQIRDDPNHTKYTYKTTDVIPVLEYGDVQF
jgi:hypothetical protein